MKIPCLIGPTASGKSALALALAARLPLEIISVDSAMIYRGMDIGTAKPSLAERQQVPHYLIDILDPAMPYSVGDFMRDAKAHIDAILSRGNIPFLVGGTMMYVNALVNGISRLPERDEAIRAALVHQRETKGLDKLYQKLQQVDPQAAAKIKPQDRQRIERALEVYELTGNTLSALQKDNQRLPYEFVLIGLLPPRKILHERIAARFDDMLGAGLIEEVRSLFLRGDLNENMPSIRSVGYRQAWQFLKGEIDAATLREKAIVATRQLAKRQITWMRSFDALKILPDHRDEALLAALSYIQ